jgi:deoxyribose-phosphate aldolase
MNLNIVQKIASLCDVSVLGAASQREQVDEIIRIASAAGCATVCVNPCYVSHVARNLPKGKTKTCSVIGYPFGQHCSATKIEEARRAIEDGADELDMVMNVGFLKDRRDVEVAEEIASIVKVADGRIVKVIIESCCLNEEELIRIAKIISDAGAQYVKTSSGFNLKGGTLEEVRLLKNHVHGHTGVKISGLGANLTFEEAVEFYDAGATRVGTRLACPMMDTIRKELSIG